MSSIMITENEVEEERDGRQKQIINSSNICKGVLRLQIFMRNIYGSKVNFVQNPQYMIKVSIMVTIRYEVEAFRL